MPTLLSISLLHNCSLCFHRRIDQSRGRAEAAGARWHARNPTQLIGCTSCRAYECIFTVIAVVPKPLRSPLLFFICKLEEFKLSYFFRFPQCCCCCWQKKDRCVPMDRNDNENSRKSLVLLLCSRSFSLSHAIEPGNILTKHTKIDEHKFNCDHWWTKQLT